MPTTEKKAARPTRKYDWVFIAYPDSMPENWEEIISELHLPCAVSPLHDADVWTDQDEKKDPERKAGTFKKPHYHILVHYESPHSLKQVKEDIVDKLNAKDPEPVISVYGQYRYLSHKDHPEKAQYSETDIKLFAGYKVPVTMDRKYTQTELVAYSLELSQLCDKELFASFDELDQYVKWKADNEKRRGYYLALSKQHGYFKEVTRGINRRIYRRPKITGEIYGAYMFSLSVDDNTVDYRQVIEDRQDTMDLDETKLDLFVRAALDKFAELSGEIPKNILDVVPDEEEITIEKLLAGNLKDL